MSQKSIRRQALRQERLLKKLCAYCGNVPHVVDRIGCSSCLSRVYKRNKAWLDGKTNDGVNVQQEYRRRIRKEVIEKYGGVCSCCKEHRWEFLAIDHVNKDGSKERNELYGSTYGSAYSYYLKLRREEKRADLQVLCYNCNCASYIHGRCPHESEKTTGQSGVS